MDSNGSRFTLSRYATEEELWRAIVEVIPSTLKESIDRKKSKLIEPYPGSKEYILNDKNNKNIAVANISEIREKEVDWCIYIET